MPEPNSDHVISTPAVDGNNYDAASESKLGQWMCVGGSGQGWTDADEIPGADSGPWKQT